MLISEPSLRTTASSISTLAWQLAKLGFEAIVVATPDSSLALLVIVSPAVKDPEGTVIVIVVELGLDITVAVVPLEDPVIVSDCVEPVPVLMTALKISMVSVGNE